MSAVFLESSEIAMLTGRKMKSHQITALRQMGIPFWVNAAGHPVVTRATVEGRSSDSEPPKRKWVSNKVLKAA